MPHQIPTPLALVRRAAEERRRALREQAEIDEFWCLFDVEAPAPHPDLRAALQLAERSGIRVALSNPCFEVWLALHFRPCDAWLTTDDAVQLRRRLDGSRDKGVDAERYLPRRHEAARRARLGHDRHVTNGTPAPDRNPSTTMYAFLEGIEP